MCALVKYLPKSWQYFLHRVKIFNYTTLVYNVSALAVQSYFDNFHIGYKLLIF